MWCQAPCAPDCALCQGLYELAQCDYVPSTVPPTPFGEALPVLIFCIHFQIPLDLCKNEWQVDITKCIKLIGLRWVRVRPA